MAVGGKQDIVDELRALSSDLRDKVDALERRVQALEGGEGGVPASLERALGIERPAADDEHLRTVAVTISPLHDVSKVRVVEAALASIDGVESATLRELHGEAAHIDVRVIGDIPLISGLRRTLPVAFDVSASDRSSFTIALAQPGAEREGGVAAPRAS